MTHDTIPSAAADDPYAALSQHLHGGGGEDVPLSCPWCGSSAEELTPGTFTCSNRSARPYTCPGRGAGLILPIWNSRTTADGRHTRTIAAEAEVERLRGASAAVRDVLAERNRQVAQEGWTEEHDDEHTQAEIAQAAACYALAGTSADEAQYIHGRWKDVRDLFWPRSWTRAWWKPTNRRRNLVKAGALILAEIERLDRASLMDAVHPDTCATPGCTNPPAIRLDDRRLCQRCYAAHDFGDDA